MSSSEIRRARILCGGFGSAPLAGISASRPVSKSGYLWFWGDRFRYAGLDESQGTRFVLLVVGASVLFASLSMMLKSWLVGGLAPLPLAIGFVWLSQRSQHRVMAFEKDYPAFLLSLASSIRTGVDPLVAFAKSHSLFSSSSVLGREVFEFSEMIDGGMQEDAAVRCFASSIQHPDIALFRTAFVLARREGSSLAECLRRLTKVTRSRQSFRRKLRGAVAMQRLSAFGILGCTVFIAVLQMVSNPEGIKLAISHPLGIKALSGGGVLIVVGLVWMLRMTKTRG